MATRSLVSILMGSEATGIMMEAAATLEKSAWGSR